MFEKLNYLNDEERIEFEKYLRIGSKFLFKQIYDYLLLENAEKVNYSDLGTCIRYDKNLRDKLSSYIFIVNSCSSVSFSSAGVSSRCVSSETIPTARPMRAPVLAPACCASIRFRRSSGSSVSFSIILPASRIPRI